MSKYSMLLTFGKWDVRIWEGDGDRIQRTYTSHYKSTIWKEL